MIKAKTSSSAKKRFRRSGGKRGLIKRAQAFRRHLLTKKSAKRKRVLRQTAYFCASDMRHVAALLPHS